ncbi:MAG: hypothetical protein M3O55_12760 [Actinomycetota bacterium]|nr:hypothetical protein [Actinomycetota bacterium]
MHLVAERFWPGATEPSARDVMARLRASCDRLAAAGVPLRYLSGTFVAADESLSCRFDGTVQGVRAAYELAGIPFDRLLTAVEVESE